MCSNSLQDALFAAIAAIGFAAISNPPRRAYIYCALIAAIGHSLRYMLINGDIAHIHIVVATLPASLLIGTLAVFMAPMAKTPAETYLFPALLPMIPGIYAYRAFGSLAACMLQEGQEAFGTYFYLFVHNALTATGIVLCMVTGATLPIFVFKKIAFQATR